MYDYVILGGGSSGCTLAARLSEDPRNSVLLVEAGKDVTAETAPADVLASYPGRAYFNPDFTWPGLNVLLGGASQNDPATRNRARYEQARILGGGSSINGLIANRGAPTDYDGWEELGATGWNFESVLPYFRKLEHDLDFNGPYHGKDGPSRSGVTRKPTGPASSARSRRCWRSVGYRSCRTRTARGRTASCQSRPRSTRTTGACRVHWRISRRRCGDGRT
jgi:choline dehydrogenase-like flavoprotein